jgi:Arc/MetJ-type ribon-helix-helix transcriptional regulator
MALALPLELEEIRAKVASGDYRDENHVIRQALALLDKFAALEAALDEGEADLREGRYIGVSTDEELAALFRDP